jgi:hypothetical protein
MKKIWLVLTLLAAAALTACGHTEPVVRYKYIGTLPPEAFLQACEVAAPPAVERYKNATWSEKEELLSKSLEQSYRNTAKCNTDKAELRSWSDKQRQLIQEKSAEQ